MENQAWSGVTFLQHFMAVLHLLPNKLNHPFQPGKGYSVSDTLYCGWSFSGFVLISLRLNALSLLFKIQINSYI